jgi:hypothetical protein
MICHEREKFPSLGKLNCNPRLWLSEGNRIPKQQTRNNSRAPAQSASARGIFWQDERDERFLGMYLIDPVRRHKHIIRFYPQRIFKSKIWLKCAATVLIQLMPCRCVRA